MPGGKLWANIRLAEADLKILGRFLRRTGQDWNQFASEAIRAALREAEAQAEGAEEAEGEALTYRRRLIEALGGAPPEAHPEAEAAAPEGEGEGPIRGFALWEAARRAHR